MILTGENRRTRRKTCPCATLSTTNPTWTDLVANPGHGGKKPETNRLSYGTAPMFKQIKYYEFEKTNRIYGVFKVFQVGLEPGSPVEQTKLQVQFPDDGANNRGS
jgi:hypothetical protein